MSGSSVRRRHAKIAILAAAVAATAGLAHAQTAAQLKAAAFRTPIPATAIQSRSLLSPADQPTAERPYGIAKTAIDHQFEDDVAGSAGFLCGLHPQADTHGGSAAYGVDPNGRFLGVQLRVALR